ncbi:MAG: hypothetical protein AB1428_06105 [Bacteroidota bacterium]
MNSLAGRACLFFPIVVLASCGPSGESSTSTAIESREIVYQRGHQLYLSMELDKAEAELRRAASMDSTYVAPATDLGSLYYDKGVREEGENNPRRIEYFRLARAWFARAEALGNSDASVYERLCEIAVALDDSKTFLKYARKNVERYPYGRQFYNLGLACYEAEDWQGVIKSQKEAIQRFKDSPYLGGFYRQMGRAYMKLDRDQTAERTLTAGVQAVEAKLHTAAKGDRKRLLDDKVGMLLLLKRLHTTYGAAEKLQQVERQLREAGYGK